MTRNLALILIFAPLLVLPTLARTQSNDYYDSRTIEIFTNSNESGKALKDLAGRASGKNFRGLGYKKGSKPELFGNIHLESDGQGYFVRDLYCGFIIRDGVGPKRIPRNNVMNTEHTWPQSKGAKREPARGDLHHLYPTDSSANSARGNHPFGEVQGEDATRNCPLSQRGSIINPKTGTSSGTFGFQPPKEHRGNVARSLFYFAARYNLRITDLEEYYLKKWHKDDPVDSAEIARNDAVQEVQGNRNPFVDFPELAERIEDF